MITTKTSDLLADMAHRLQAISSAIYEAGYRDEARDLETAAHKVAMTAVSIDSKIANGARAMMRDDASPTSEITRLSTLGDGE